MKWLYILGLLFFISHGALGQSGKISGKVINAGSGQPLSNATLTLVEKSKTEVAGQNGEFSFSKLEPGTYSIKCSYSGHIEKTVEEIIVKNNEITPVTISLEEIASGGVIVTSTKTKAAGETLASLLIAQKNSASVSDGISAESIRKTPDRSTGDVLKRVSGASIQDDRFAVIRGLNDRYNASFINGAPLPSTESDRKAFSFDIFPSAILDNLIIYKTATPDKTGDFGGGIIDITTKSILSKSFLSISFGTSYNSMITGNTRYFSDNKGKKDWIGLDDGTRGMPTGIPSSTDFLNLNNTQKAELAKLFGNYKWGVQKTIAKPNFSFQLTKGFNIEKKDKEFLGVIFSVNYNHNFTFNKGERNTYDYDANPDMPLIQRGRFEDSIYNEEVILAGLANISLKINNRNTLTWKNNMSVNTDNKLVKRFGNQDYSSDPTFFARDIVRWYTSSQIFTSQLSGEHQIGNKKTKINWLGSYSKVERDIPNLSRTSYLGSQTALQPFFTIGQPNQLFGTGTMMFVNSVEDIKSIKVDITQPYTLMKNSQNQLKIGGGYQFRDRSFLTRLLGLTPYSGGSGFDNSLYELPEDQLFLREHLGLMKNGKGGFTIGEGLINNSNYVASSALTHAYIMSDQRFFSKFRLIYGVRMETFNQKLNTRNIGNNPQTTINTEITDFLPSVNFVYSITAKMNLRLSYSQTVNRPEFRELAPFVFFDNISQFVISGLDTLSRARIKNYDIRYELFPGRAQLFSVSGFYKDFTNPVEIILVPGSSNLQAFYSNAASAKVYGAEIEFRTLLATLLGIKRENGIWNKLTLTANAAYMKSTVKLGRVGLFDPSLLVTDRALQGQSPYLINGSLGYNDDKAGLASTISVNRVGDRIFVAGIKDQSADIYEKARTVVDFQLTKLFMKNVMELKFMVRDILAQGIDFYSDFDLSKSFTDRDRLFSSYKAPRVFSLSATLKF